MGWIVLYMIVGCLFANCCEYTDGSKGIQAPGRFALMAAFWPLLALYTMKCVVGGSATLRRTP